MKNCAALSARQFRQFNKVFRGAIFDQDGLLFDTEAVFEVCWIKAGEEMGLPVTPELTRSLSGFGKRELEEAIAIAFPGADAARIVERAHSLAAEAQLSSIPVVKPGVREILSFCRENSIRTAVASSSMRHLVEHNLSATGLSDFFDAIVTGRDVLKGKPAPDIFLLAAQKIELEPSSCIVFEDAFSGIRAAHAAGCCPVLIPDRRMPDEEILKICKTRSSLLEAMDLL